MTNPPYRTPDLIARETGKVLPEQEAYLYLTRVAHVLGMQVEDLLEAHKLSRKQYNVLRAIRRTGPGGATVNQVGQQMSDPRADVTRLVDRLERDGLVHREHDAADRRVVRVRLSEVGRELLREIDEPLLDVHRAQFGNFEPNELEVLKALLQKIA